MHPNPIYRRTDPAYCRKLAVDRGFGMLAVNADPAPLLAHIPFCPGRSQDELVFHLMRSNPIARLSEQPLPAVLAVAGPDGYISPDWYGIEGQVPTWNYAAVHLRGRIGRLPDSDLRWVLDSLSDSFENRLSPKSPWRSDKMEPDAMARLMRMVQPFRLNVESVDSTIKLSQNKPDAARLGAAQAVAASGIGQETARLAALMADPPAAMDS